MQATQDKFKSMANTFPNIFQYGTRDKYRVLIGTEHGTPENLQKIKNVFAASASGYTYTVGVGGWHSDGAPYAGGGQDPANYMEEPVHIFEIVVSPGFDFIVHIVFELSKVLPGIAEQIMVEYSQITANHFSVAGVRSLIFS